RFAYTTLFRSVSGANDQKTQRLVQEICDFEYIVTSSEIEALILEMNLIKKYDPKYNVMLKDDKSYPYLKITHERHPRLLITRKVKKDKGKDRKSTRLNSSHVSISYAVFCLK